ncbi:MAG: alpha/beta hydrolase [Cytophagales bacterium]
MEVKKSGKFEYIDEGKGDILLLLHGLFGALSNWEHVVNEFKKDFRVIIPLMPIYSMPRRKASVDGLVDFIEEFVEKQELKDLTLLGNSLGGHVALVYTLSFQSNVKKLVLTGSSGLFENSMGGSFPKRGNQKYIKERVEYTFYDPKTASDELIEEVFEITSSIPKCLNIVAIAKAAQRHNLANELHKIKVPTLLIWGLNDTITPPMVAHEFHRLIPNSKLSFIDKCCHAPMMERPEEFKEILSDFLRNQ